MKNRLAGFISGSRVDLVKVDERRGELNLTHHKTYLSSEFSTFDAVLALYLRKNKIEFDFACFGVAGPVVGNSVDTTNLPWRLNSPDIATAFNMIDVKLVNDTIATAHALPSLHSDRLYMISKGKKKTVGNIGLISAGSGLGQAVIYVDGEMISPCASEGGHAGFSPGNQREVELWEFIYSELGRVEVEDVISLRGLVNIYNFIVETEGGNSAAWFEKAADKPVAIIEKALAGKDDKATKTLELFVDCYATEAANLALKGMTLGGLYLGGNIARDIVTLLDNGRFLKRFIKGTRLSALLKSIPVAVIIEEKTPLIGASRLALKL